MITIDFEKRGAKGLCEFLYGSIKTQILDGILPADSKLPSKRSLASHLGVSIITVQNAYAQLIAEGYIYSIEKKGFFVTDLSALKKSLPLVEQSERNEEPKFVDNPLLADFTANQTSAEKFPFTLWARTMRQVLNSGNEKLLRRSDLKGIFELRFSIAEYLREFRNMSVSPAQIVIGSGTESLYSLLVQFFGRDKIFGVENPGYKKAKVIFELNGAECIPVNLDALGISIEELEKTSVQIIHTSPNHHFPTGIVMPVRRRMELLEWCNKSPERFIIEDDYDSEFRFNGKPLPTLQSFSTQNNVIYMNTFTKTLSPSFRISYMVLPMAIVESFMKKLGSYSCQVSVFEQFTLAEFIDRGFYETHINRMKNYYRSLRNNLIQAIQNSALMPLCRITEQESGLHFLLSLRSEKNPKILQKQLLELGIKIPLLSDYFYENPGFDSGEVTFIMNYSGIKKEKIEKIIERIGQVI